MSELGRGTHADTNEHLELESRGIIGSMYAAFSLTLYAPYAPYARGTNVLSLSACRVLMIIWNYVCLCSPCCSSISCPKRCLIRASLSSCRYYSHFVLLYAFDTLPRILYFIFSPSVVSYHGNNHDSRNDSLSISWIRAVS